MMNYKIIQIIPNNVPMVAQYRAEDGLLIDSPILMFALVEYEDGDREILPFNSDCLFSFVDEATSSSNFVGVKHLGEFRYIDYANQTIRNTESTDRDKGECE